MEEILQGTKIMLVFAVVADVVVFVAMMTDLASGIYKSRIRGEFTRSELLKRTGYKFCLYEGSMMIALCVDVLIHFTHLYEWIGLPHTMQNLPLVSFVMAIFWCAVEYLSIREKAEEKNRVKIREAEHLLSLIASKDLRKEILEYLKCKEQEDKKTKK